MRAYSDAYLEDVVENQGKLFDLVAQSFPDKDTGDFIKAYHGCQRTLGLFYGDRTVPDEAGKVDRWIYAGLDR